MRLLTDLEMMKGSAMFDELFGPEAAARDGAEILSALKAAARERILILDGAMGTEIQGLGFDEGHFRGERFAGCADRRSSGSRNSASAPDRLRLHVRR